MQEIKNYNYQTFSASFYKLDAFVGPEVGDKAPDFNATTIDGKRVKLSDYLGKPLILETGSISCPQYVGCINSMNTIAVEYPEFEFLVLYVREAHPGNNITGHHSIDEKITLANRTHEAEQENRTIIIDDIDGTAHQSFGSLPNMLYVIGADGTILTRSDWNQPSTIRKSLEKLRNGEDVSNSEYGFRPATPPVVIRVLARAGWDAGFDLFINLPALIVGHIKAFFK